MKKQRLIIFVLCICFNLSTSLIFSQIVDLNREYPYKKVFVDTDNFGASYLNILEKNYTQVKPDTIRFSMLHDLAYYWHTRNLTKAEEFTKEGLKLTQSKNDTLWNGRFNIVFGAILLRQEKLDSAYIVLDRAIDKVKEEDLAFLNTQLGYVYERRGQLDMAADYALETLRLGEKLNDKKAKAVAYSDLSNLFWKQSRFKMGLEYGLKSLSLFEDRGINDLDYDFTLYVVGNNYLELKKYEKALQYFEHAKSIGERYGFYNNLSDVYISLVNLYAYLQDYEAANIAGEKAIEYAELLDNNFMLMRSWLSLGKAQHLEGKYISAIESIKRSIKVATENFGDAYYLSQAYETLGKAYAGNHNYKDAYDAIAKFDNLKAKIFTTESDKHISLLQTEFDVAQKESMIQQQQMKLNQQRTRQTLIIIIAVLLLLLLVILYKTFKLNKKKNKLLEKQNREKEFLLKEIHHRVKNNLEIVSSLLSLQSAQTNDSTVIDAMQESQNRVQSMSMIHQKLYQGKNLGTIEMKDYLINLGSHVLDSFGAEQRIVLECVMDILELDVDTAVPLGLIVNELITNALKYAFPEGRKGQIEVQLAQKSTDKLILKVIDNGIGQEDDDFTRGTGFGMQLIQLLTQQLNGTMEHVKSNGTVVAFEFKLSNVT
ncbi:Two-component system sensor histidine kinase [hydrothermal vent metagenome]|jgi:two-component system, sensor histidine kinase PdtaS|uniref:histidine kinase n=1 Tax=hydrothermal vent metagenome TaxID=652676 RepID=A0A3B0R1I1_9ZZZZ